MRLGRIWQSILQILTPPPIDLSVMSISTKLYSLIPYESELE